MRLQYHENIHFSISLKPTPTPHHNLDSCEEIFSAIVLPFLIDTIGYLKNNMYIFLVFHVLSTTGCIELAV